MKYRKKPVTIEAIQFTDSDERVQELIEFARENFTPHGDLEHYTYAVIKTLEGDHRADIGDYIIKGVQGEFYPCKPDIFNMTYEAVEEEGEKCDTECIYNRGNECPAASGCAGHEEAICDDHKEYCCNCRWYDIDAGVCCNASSDYCADFRSMDDSCEEWEER